jgi:hypothetical protein
VGVNSRVKRNYNVVDGHGFSSGENHGEKHFCLAGELIPHRFITGYTCRKVALIAKTSLKTNGK